MKRNSALQLFDQDCRDKMAHFYIRVTDIKKTTTTDTIHNCFDNTRRFGVGNVYFVDRQSEEECDIFFKREGDFESIVGQSNSIDDKRVTVVEDGRAFDDRILIQNLNASTTKDGLKCFIKAQTGHNIANIVFIDPGGTAIVEFEKMIDFSEVESACKEDTLDNNHLRMKPVKSSTNIVVSGCQELTKDEVLYYFDNTRQSGGADVTEIDKVDDDTYLIQFSSPKCVIDVCKRKHFLKELPLTVQLQHFSKKIGQLKKFGYDLVASHDETNTKTSVQKVTDENLISIMYKIPPSTTELHLAPDNKNSTDQSTRLTKDMANNIESKENKKHDQDKTKSSCFKLMPLTVYQQFQIPKGLTKREIRDITVMPNGQWIVLDYGNSEMIMDKCSDVISLSKELKKAMFLTSTAAGIAVSSMDEPKVAFFDISTRTIIREVQMSKTVLGMTIAHKQLLVREGNMGCRFISSKGPDNLIPIRGDYMPYIAEWNNKIFLTNWKTHDIYCYNTSGELEWSFDDEKLRGPNGVTTDNAGNIYVVGTYSHNILIISTNYQDNKEYFFTNAGMKYPIAIEFDRINNKLIVCNMTGTVKIFQV